MFLGVDTEGLKYDEYRDIYYIEAVRCVHLF